MENRPLLLVLLSTLSLTHGYFVYKDRIPNGRHVPHPCITNYLWHGVGHNNFRGGGDRNPFGEDFKRHGLQWTPELCRLDSDGDGMTNGQELGDPDCVWTPDSPPTRTEDITHPAICNPWEDMRCKSANRWVGCVDEEDELDCDSLKEPETQNLTLRLPRTKVPSQETTYICVTMDLPDDDVYHMTAMKPYVDNEQVLHHIAIFSCEDIAVPPTLTTPGECSMSPVEGCQSLVGGWTVGFKGFCTGNRSAFLFGKGSFNRVKVQFHWNNPELRSDYYDSSGVTIFYTKKLRPANTATMVVGQYKIDIPPLRPSFDVVGKCDARCSSKILTQTLYIGQAFNHMHHLGIKQKVELVRDGQTVAIISDNQDYHYDRFAPTIHDPAVEMRPGDEIVTTCTYNSMTRNHTTVQHESTSGEMCFAFLGVYPREALPVTKYCLGYQSFSICENLTDLRESQVCNMNTVADFSTVSAQQQKTMVLSSCSPFGPCDEECRRMYNNLKVQPCMRADNFPTLKQKWMETYEGMLILAALDSCIRPRDDCGPCTSCPVGRSRSTSDGALSSLWPLTPALSALLSRLLSPVFL